MIQEIGRYKVIKELGQGGMAKVFLAHDPVMERDVALKLMLSQFTADPQFGSRFQREAKSIASLEHRGIVPVYDYGISQKQPFLVMRYMTNGSLGELLRKGLLNLETINKIIGELALSLDFAHKKGFVHRDLKPDNILFDAQEIPYLSDFGIVKMIEDSSTALTVSGGIIGTPAYMSPEQARGIQDLDGRSDVYALGVILFEMLTGRRPYEADTPMGLAMMHVLEPVPILDLVHKDLSQECQLIIDKAMAKDREKRYTTASALASDVARMANDAAVPVKDLPETELLFPSGVRASTPREESSSDIPTIDTIKDRRIRFIFLGLIVGLSLLSISVIAIWLLFGQNDSDRNKSTEATIDKSLAIAIDEGIVTKSAEQDEAATPIIVSPSIPSQTQSPSVELADNSTEAVTTTPEKRNIEVWDAPLPTGNSVEMVLVPSGYFTMGSDNGYDEEKPIHRVYLDDYWIDRTEVSVEQYMTCVNAGECVETRGFVGVALDRGYMSLDDYFTEAEFSNFPIVRVNWYEAGSYCNWRGMRLPSEAEWEKAARGTESRTYPWGETLDCTRANVDPCAGDLKEVDSLPDGASPYGAVNMIGNVWEWVADWYDAGYYDKSPESNPDGPEIGYDKVLRGGARWRSAPPQTSTRRLWTDPDDRDDTFGFRCAGTRE